jgi:hypothetical protein
MDIGGGAGRRTVGDGGGRRWPRATVTRRPGESLGCLLRRARRTRQWSQPRLIHEMRRVAGVEGKRLPCNESLKAMISRWENDRQVPDDFNRAVLCAALRIPLAAVDPPWPWGSPRPWR